MVQWYWYSGTGTVVLGTVVLGTVVLVQWYWYSGTGTVVYWMVNCKCRAMISHRIPVENSTLPVYLTHAT